MISVNNLSIHFTGTDLFSNVSFLINDRDRIGLTGKNGSGKTTLLNIIAGILEPQTGEVIIPPGTHIGYLPQETDTLSNETVYGEAMTAFAETVRLEKEIKKLTGEISLRTDYESKKYAALVQKLTEANEQYSLTGGTTMQADIERVLTGLGFTRNDLHRPLKEFSRGWQMRVELAKILLRRPEVILLDEPTNHLDIESIQWLEDFLKNYYGAVVMVSHDRAFLDNVTKRTIEISGGKIYDYKASFSGYVKMREERLEQQMASYNNQQKQIKEIERFIERFRYKSTKARQVQSRIKMLNKMEEIEFDDIEKSSIRFRFPPAPRAGKVVIEAINLGKKYGEHTVLENVNFAVINGDKVAFVGKNGEGKTTLAKIITGELEYSGNLKYGHNVQTGYFAQNQGEYLDPEKTVFETIDDIATGEIRKNVRTILGSFLFSGDTIDKKVKVLSGGEKARLSLAKLLLTPSNLLVLDEPTNHLDMQSKDILKNALLQFDGTLIIVSHDRDFLEGLTSKLFEFGNRQVKEHLGGIYEFLEKKRLKTLKQLEEKRAADNEKKETVSRNKMEYELRKQLEREKRKINNDIKKCEERIETLEKEIDQSNKILSDPASYFENPDYEKLNKDYENLRNELDKEMEKWEELQLKLEKLIQ